MDLASEVLYEVSVCCEWTDSDHQSSGSDISENEPENLPKSQFYLRKIFCPFLWLYWTIARYFASWISRFYVPEMYAKLPEAAIPWKITTIRCMDAHWNPDNSVIAAVVMNDKVELRKSVDEFVRCEDEFRLGQYGASSQFRDNRQLAWSPDGKFLACIEANGTLSLYSHPGGKKTSIAVLGDSAYGGRDTHRGAFALHWVPYSLPNSDWRLLCLDSSGVLRILSVSSESTARLSGRVQLRKFCSCLKGTLGVIASKRHNLLVVASSVTGYVDEQPDSFWTAGISLWRMIDEDPYVKLVSEPQSEEAKRSGGLYSKWKFARDGIHKMYLNESETSLLTLFTSGAIAVWSFPSLRLRRFWTVRDIPDYCSTRVSTSLVPDRELGKNPVNYPVDVKWWSDDAIVLIQAGGAVSLLDITGRELVNISHGSFEQFTPGCVASECFDHKFLVLEEIDGMGSKNGSVEVTSDDDTLNLISQTLEGMATGSDLKPQKKRKRYRLNCFQSASPLEFFQRKLANEEYGEALLIAERFGLDKDLVYQTRWMKNRITKHTVEDFLAKVSKTSWVLKQCLERVPDDPDVAKTLLDMGLRLTDFNVVFPDVTSTSPESIPQDISLSEEQQNLLKCRRKLLALTDMLGLYEDLLGGGEKAKRYFLADEYEKIRSKSPVELALDYAHEGKVKELHTLHFVRFEEVNPYWLDILSNIPESVAPNSYMFLIPTVLNGEIVVPKHKPKRRDDWLEGLSLASLDECSAVCDESLLKWHPMNMEKLGQFLEQRILEIEEKSGLVEHSQQLLQIACVRAKDVLDLNDLRDELATLKDLMYETKQQDMTLKKLRTLGDAEVLRCLDDEDEDEDSYTMRLRNIIFPFIQRCKRKSPDSVVVLLREYVLSTVMDAKGSLKKCAIIVGLLLDPPFAGKLDVELHTIVRLALDCIESSVAIDQLELTKGIIQRLLTNVQQLEVSGSVALTARLVRDSKLIKVVDFVSQFGIQMNVKSLLELESDADKVTGFAEHVLKSAVSKVPGFSDKEAMDFLSKFLLLGEVMGHLEGGKALQLFVVAWLTSGKAPYIQFALDLLDIPQQSSVASLRPTSVEKRRGIPSVPREKSITILLDAGRHYFNLSENWKDPKLQHARRCFELMSDLSSEAVQELKLIDALMLLHQSGIDLEPMELRFSSDRFRFIDMVLDIKPDIYKYHRRLSELAECLGMRNDSRVLEAACLKSLAKKDFSTCKEICSEIIARELDTSWSLFMKLAAAEDFKDWPYKEQIISLALECCPDENLAEVVNLHTLIRSRVLSASFHPPQKSVSLQPISQLSLPPFAVNNGKLRTSTMKGLSKTRNELKHLPDLLSQMFYKAVGISQLAESIEDTLVSYACHVCSVDSALALSMLGCLSSKADAENAFMNVESGSVLVSTVAAYFYALEAALYEPDLRTIKKVFQQPCKSLIHQVIHQKETEADAVNALLELARLHYPKNQSASSNSTPLIQNLEANPAMDLTSPNVSLAGQLKTLNIPDQQRFLSNVEYRRNMLFRASGTTRADTLRTVMDLAEQHGVETWEVVAHFVKYLFTGSSLSASDMKKALDTHARLLIHLKERKKEFIRFSGQQIQPLMANADIDVLELYFEFFENIKRSG